LKKHIALIFLFQLSLATYGQEIEIANIFLKGENVEVRYNILDDRIDRSYAVKLYTSKDNFIQPMELISGYADIDIEVGDNKKLTWNAIEELGNDFQGDVSLEIKGNYFVPCINMMGIQEDREFKRGKAYEFVWSGGRGDNILEFQLYQNGNIIKDFEERANTGNTELVIPSNVKPGKHYQLKISNANNSYEVVFTEEFNIKRKYPLNLQVGVGVLSGRGIGTLINALQPKKEYEVLLTNLRE
jgi:hypothetical protein